MTSPDRSPIDAPAAEAMIEELLRTALWLFDISTSLLDELPEGAFPDEDSAAVLVEMLAGSCRPAIDSAGAAGCRAMMDLAVAIRENIRGDLHAAAELARTGEVLL